MDIIYNYTGYSPEELCKYYLRTLEGKYAFENDFNDWLDTISFEIADFTAENWINANRDRIHQQAQNEIYNALLNLYPGSSNKKKRKKTQNSQEYKDAVNNACPKVADMYRDPEYWEARKDDLYKKEKPRTLETIRRKFSQMVSDYNKRVIGDFCEAKDVEGIIRDSAGAVTDRMQELLDAWLMGNEIVFYVNDYDWYYMEFEDEDNDEDDYDDDEYFGNLESLNSRNISSFFINF